MKKLREEEGKFRVVDIVKVVSSIIMGDQVGNFLLASLDELEKDL